MVGDTTTQVVGDSCYRRQSISVAEGDRQRWVMRFFDRSCLPRIPIIIFEYQAAFKAAKLARRFSVDCQRLIDQMSMETKSDRREIERGWVFRHMAHH